MREIKFRGTDELVAEWAYGYLFVDQNGANYVMDTNNDGDNGISLRFILVNSKTVGQFIGIKDIHETEIFTKDIVTIGEEKTPCLVYWDEALCAFMFKVIGKRREIHNCHAARRLMGEIIGNAIDNPELLKEE